MATSRIYSNKDDFETKNPYVLVSFETINGSSFPAIDKSFINKKSADKYYREKGTKNQEVMTRRKFNKEALMAM